MERVTLILQASLTLLVILAGAIFAVAEGRTGIPAITIPAALVAFLLVDRSRCWSLSDRMQALLGLVGFGLAGIELLLSDIEAPLLAGGHLLTYLTCAFLFQPKGRRQLWWLAALSLLQVAVSSVLTYDSWFGLAMPVFLLLMLWTLAVFQLHQAAGLAQASASAAPRIADAEPAEYWLGRSQATPAVQMDDQHRWVTPRFVLSMFSSTVLSVLVAGLFFALIPRVWPSTAPVFFEGGRPVGGAPPQTGYTSDISLGHVGEIQESPRVAVEVRLRRAADGQPMPWNEWLKLLGDAPRLRGGVQETYDRGTWRRWEGAIGSHRSFQELPPLFSAQVLEEVRIHHHRAGSEMGDVVFSSGMPLSCRSDSSSRDVELELSGWAMSARGTRSTSIQTYTVEAVPWDPWFPNAMGRLGPDQWLPREPWREYLRTCSETDAGLSHELKEWCLEHRDVTSQARSSYDVARAWERWFSSGTEFSYSLNLAVADPTVDPLIDFLRNTRRGHCEYFASALALVLRAYRIPTRVVSGYRGGQIEADGTLVVRDLHAHLWVEAFLPDAPADPASGQYGPRWVTLEPTPSARDSLVQSREQQSQSVWAQLRSNWGEFWTNSIRMNYADQQGLIYGPMKSGLRGLTRTLRGGNMRARLGELVRFLTSPQEWFSWQGGLVSFVLLVLLSGVEFGRRRLWNWIARRSQGRGTGGRTEISVPFYRRFEALLAEHGLRRASAQTPREFVSLTAVPLCGRLPERLQAVPSHLADQFYAVRYGGKVLSAADEAAALRQLEDLERELAADALRQVPARQRRAGS